MDSVFAFGKYKGYKVYEVMEEDPQYILWAEENVSWISFSSSVLSAIKRDPPGKHRLYIYRVTAKDKSEKFFKIGMSSKTKIGDRFDPIFEDSLAHHYTRTFYRHFEFSSRKMALLAEQKLHDAMAEFKYQPLRKFSGHTECYARSKEATERLKRLCRELVIPFQIDNSIKTARNCDIWRAFQRTKTYKVTKSNPKLMSREYRRFKNKSALL